MGLSRPQSLSSRSGSPNLVQADWAETAIATVVAWTFAAYWLPLGVSLVNVPVVEMSCCQWGPRKYGRQKVHVDS